MLELGHQFTERQIKLRFFSKTKMEENKNLKKTKTKINNLKSLRFKNSKLIQLHHLPRS